MDVEADRGEWVSSLIRIFHNAVMHVEDESVRRECGRRGTSERLHIPRYRGPSQHGTGSKLMAMRTRNSV